MSESLAAPQWTHLIYVVANVLFIMFCPLLFLGVINKVKAFWGGRQGASIFQPFYDVSRLLQKSQVISKSTSPIFRLAPIVGLAATTMAAFATPIFGHEAIFSFTGDFVFFAYILATAKFCTVAAALDTGSSFEGMGASREVTLSALVEPAFFLTIGSLALLLAKGSFSGITSVLQTQSAEHPLVAVLTAGTFFIMMLVEGCRIPVDDPNTHLELTMIHEVMILDNSGPDLAAITYSAALKMVLIGALIANVLIPTGLNPLLSGGMFLSYFLLMAALIGTIESGFARLRMTHLPQFVFLMTSLGVVILSSVLLFR